MIGQSQVTDPLMTALRADRVNHAYLFSGPRGCGKTTSARILARCLNCAEGPTDTPCGKCDSCIELGRGGGGSLDVVEIDAASHNGVDDARDLRERAVFAPARDRYKIFILDEAHMVTPQGFNALLKLVEEPPDHVKFIFATTEPEKVLGTIRSRTHHYPFRLVPPAQMLEYVQTLCDAEGVKVAPGVLPLVVRAGGGSPRDTLSLLDQLMAGSEDSTVDYERAVALLGYTHGALLDEVIDAIAARDAAAAFGGVDRVIQTGQDPRRFVEDLLERLRDLIVVAATTAKGAAAVLRGVPQDELEHMAAQAARFGQAELSRTADIVNSALTEMTGATSPRLHLELLVARALVPNADESSRGALARVERLERRVGVEGSGVEGSGAGTTAPDAARPAGTARASAPAASVPAAPVPAAPTPAAPTPAAPVAPVSAAPAPKAAPGGPAAASTAAETPESAASTPKQPQVKPVGPVTLQQVKDAWPEVLDTVKTANMNAWMVVFTAQVRDLRDDVLVLAFPSQNDVEAMRRPGPNGNGVADIVKRAVNDLLGFTPKFIARVEGPAGGSDGAGGTSSDPSSPSGPAAPDRAEATPGASTGTASADAAAPASSTAPAPASASKPTAKAAVPASPPASDEVYDGWATITIPSGDATVAQAPAAVEAAESVATPAAEKHRDEPPFDEPPFDDVAPPEDEPGEPGWASAAPDYVPDAAPAAAPATVPTAQAAQAAQAAPVAKTPKDSQIRPATRAAGGRPAASGAQRYGEAVVREVLGATFLEEQEHTPKTGFRTQG
jgi:DNA polymerase-3 subunit gamma/tau